MTEWKGEKTLHREGAGDLATKSLSALKVALLCRRFITRKGDTLTTVHSVCTTQP